MSKPPPPTPEKETPRSAWKPYEDNFNFWRNPYLIAADTCSLTFLSVGAEWSSITFTARYANLLLGNLSCTSPSRDVLRKSRWNWQDFPSRDGGTEEGTQAEGRGGGWGGVVTISLSSCRNIFKQMVKGGCSDPKQQTHTHYLYTWYVRTIYWKCAKPIQHVSLWSSRLISPAQLVGGFILSAEGGGRHVTLQ